MPEPCSRVGKEVIPYVRGGSAAFHTTRQGSKGDRAQREKKEGIAGVCDQTYAPLEALMSNQSVVSDSSMSWDKFC